MFSPTRRPDTRIKCSIRGACLSCQTLIRLTTICDTGTVSHTVDKSCTDRMQSQSGTRFTNAAKKDSFHFLCRCKQRLEKRRSIYAYMRMHEFPGFEESVRQPSILSSATLLLPRHETLLNMRHKKQEIEDEDEMKARTSGMEVRDASFIPHPDAGCQNEKTMRLLTA